MPAYVVRPAVVADADRVGVVHVQVWQEAYREHMPADYLAALDPVESARRWRERLEHPAPDRVLLVATADGEVVAMASAGPSRDDPPEPARELYAINVLASHHGTGLADRLLRAALDSAVGDAAVSLWVVEANHRARAFYRRYGFVPDGSTARHDGTGVAEVRLVRPAR